MPQPKKHLRKKDYARVEELAGRGVAEKSIARAVGVSWHRWRALRDGEDPRAAAALERGRAKEHDALVGALFSKAMAGNVTAAIFLLKCRHGYIDQPKPETVDNKVQITFQLPAPLDPAEYDRLVSAAPPRALREAGLDGGDGAGGDGPGGDGAGPPGPRRVAGEGSP
ncbi:MAG: hypothetical protein ACLF0P_17435 [Thermoanaerobaculia bacterium]